MILYDDQSKSLKSKQLSNLNSIWYMVNQLWYCWDQYVSFLSKDINSRWVINTEWKLILKPEYAGFIDFYKDLAIFLEYDELTWNSTYWVLSLLDWKEIIEPKFLNIIIREWRFFWQVDSTDDWESVVFRQEIDKNWELIWQPEDSLEEILFLYKLEPHRKDVSYWWSDDNWAYLWLYNEAEEIDFLRIPDSEISKGWYIANLCEPKCTKLKNWVILLNFEENELIIGVTNDGKHLFNSKNDDFLKNMNINNDIEYTMNHSHWNVYFLSESYQTLDILDTNDFLKEIKDIWKWFYTVWNNKYYWNPGDKLKNTTKTSELSEILSLCEETTDNIEINWKKFNKRLLKLK